MNKTHTHTHKRMKEDIRTDRGDNITKQARQTQSRHVDRQTAGQTERLTDR